MRQRLANSVDRLRKLLELDAPDVIVATEVASTVKHAMMLWPKEAGAAIGESFGKSFRRIYGLCMECGKTCEDQNESECIACRLDAEVKYGADVDQIEQEGETGSER